MSAVSGFPETSPQFKRRTDPLSPHAPVHHCGRVGIFSPAAFRKGAKRAAASRLTRAGNAPFFRWRGSCTSFARPASWNMSSACCAGTPSVRAYVRMTRASSRGTSNGRLLILDSPDFDLKRALDQQIELLELRRERIGNLTDMAKALRGGEGTPWNSSRSTRASWTHTPSRRRRRGGKTPQWREYEEKWAGRSKGEQVAKIRAFITENYYACTNKILAGLGRAYGAGGDFTQNINAAASRRCRASSV